MNNLKHFRTVLAVLFFAASVMYLFLGLQRHPLAVATARMQIIPSALAVTMGVILVWLALTFVFGRIYCSTICPVGTLQDATFTLRLKLANRLRPKRISYKSHKRYTMRYHILIVYAICLIIGIIGIPYLIEPWNIMKNIAYAICPSAGESAWITLGLGMTTGIIAGFVTLLLLLLSGFLYGRDFCNLICPIGTCLGAIAPYSLWHIEIDPDKCINCMKCEEECRSKCINVVSRYVDNSRCVRCFNCVKVCPNDAIRYQRNRNRPALPLFQRKAGTR